MIADAPDFAAVDAFGAEICVIGGGPVGLSVALELVRRGRRVLVLESGGRGARAAAQALAEAENLTPGAHLPPEITVARRLGGTSNLWGGRCLPFDPIDFAARPWLELPAWPIGPAELAPWLGPACAALGAGEPAFREALPGVAADAAFGFESLERWSNVPRTQVLHAPRAPKAPRSWWRSAPRRSASSTPTGGSPASRRTWRGGAGGGSPRRRWFWRPAATRARGCCSPSSGRGPGSSAAPTGRSGGSTWGT